MKTILFHPPTPDHSGMFGSDDEVKDKENELYAPWYYLRARLLERGFIATTTYNAGFDIKNAYRVVFMNIPDELRSTSHRVKFQLQKVKATLTGKVKAPSLYKQILKAGLQDKLTLMIWEPSVVIPENGREDLHQLFPRVFTWNERYLNKKSIYKQIRWPQPYKIPPIPPGASFSKRKLLVNFSGNKTSSHPRELYSERKKVIEYMKDHCPLDFDHFGPGWEGYPQWKGFADSKFEIYPKYKFGLCYENLLDEPGYITEKIFDSIRGNCVPVYWGDPNIQELIPEDVYIDRRKYSSTQELIFALSNITENEWKLRLEAGQKYIESDDFKKFLPEEFSQLVIKGLELDF